MAKQVGTRIIGTFGNIIYYKWRGEYYLRTKGITKQSPQAKKQALLLGTAANLSGRLRKALVPIIGMSKDRKLMYRLNNVFRTWLGSNPKKEATTGSIPLFKGFSFYGKSVNSYFTAPILVRWENGALSLHIPACSAATQKQLAGGRGYLTVMAVCCNPDNKADTRICYTRVNMDTNDPQNAELYLEKRGACIIVIAMSVNDWAAGIIEAIWGR